MAEFNPSTELSVVVPVKNEAGNILPLISEIDKALSDQITYEIIIVDDGSNDETGFEVDGLCADQAHVRLLTHERCCGQSQATITGGIAASGEWVVTLDGDGQNVPADILKLLSARAHLGNDAACSLFIGNRSLRQDNFMRRIVSRIANKVRGFVLGDCTPDSGCGLKLLRRELFLGLPRFDALHRFMPALVIRSGGRVLSVPVSHRPRSRGVSKYGIWKRLALGLLDMFGVAWLQIRYTKPPKRSN